MPSNQTKAILQITAFLGLLAAGLSAYLVESSLAWQICLGIAVLSFGAALWLGRGEVKQSLSKRTVRYGLNSLFMSAIVVAIVVVLNLIATNHDQKIDLTKNQAHSLSEQTVKILKGLTRDVTFKAFVSPMQIASLKALFDKYSYHSKHIKTEFVDVDRNPLAAQENNIKETGTVIIESNGRTARVDRLGGSDDPKAEEKLTNAIIQVEKGDKRKIYFVGGHGEKTISDRTRGGYSNMRDTLSYGRFNVEELNLLEKDKIPADAEILIFGGPKKDFFPKELAQVDEYIRKGGKVLFMVEPDSTKELAPFLAKYGIKWAPKKTVLERDRRRQLMGDPLSPLVANYDQGHDISRDIREASIYKIATPVEKTEAAPEGMKVSPLFSTSDNSQELEVQGDRAVPKPGDRKGPLNLGMAVSGKAVQAAPAKDAKNPPAEGAPAGAEFRVVVIGDSDFAVNAYKDFGANSDIFQNILSWLVKEEELIAIRPKPTDQSEFDITEQRYRVITVASVFVLPFMMLLSGILVWAVRRKK